MCFHFPLITFRFPFVKTFCTLGVYAPLKTESALDYFAVDIKGPAPEKVAFSSYPLCLCVTTAPQVLTSDTVCLLYYILFVLYPFSDMFEVFIDEKF